ncbi:MAG: 2-dehydro-3-deoxygalactonokinase [Comamonas sp.]
MQTPTLTPTLIALDWGTTSLRAYAYAPGGQVLERRHSPHGITQLPAPGEAGFAQALSALVGDWVAASPGAPLVACGMVGSAQGWREAAYVPVPTGLGQLASRATALPLDALGGPFAGKLLHILPGLIEHGELPNVMRGEETQIFGALQTLPQPAGRPLVIGLPGTHSKWARVEQGAVVHFDTFMTGEVYAALCSHTILGRTMERGGTLQPLAFERGLRVAASQLGAHGALGTIFSSRALGLTGALAPAEQPDYLSGLLIGHEVQALARQWGSALPDIWLIGDEALCGRYAQALRLSGITDARWLPQATETGLWHLGRAIAATTASI